MIYLSGDLHGEIDIGKLSSKQFPEGKNLSKSDYVIILGDFGLLWRDEPNNTEKYWLKWLQDKPWTTLFLDGNHENFNRLNNLPEVHMFNSKVGYVNDSIFHLKRGHIYNINGNTFLTIGGAESIDKFNRIENISWWKQELISYEEQNFIFDNLQDVNYVLTHTCPKSIFVLMNLNALKRNDHTMKLLEEVKNRINFKHWYFGHFHFDHFINSEFTVLYNSIIKI